MSEVNKPKTLEELSEQAGVDVADVQKDISIHDTTPEAGIGNVLSLNKKDVPIISSDDGKDIVTKDKKKLDEMTTKTEVQSGQESIAEAEKYAGAKSMEERQKLEDDGSYTTEELVNLGLTDFSNFTQTSSGKWKPNEQGYADLGITGVSSEQNELQEDIDVATQNLERMEQDFLTYSVSDDPEFAEISSNIKTQYERLKAEARDYNERYQAGLRQIGIRTGARYTGGIFEGIMAEAQSQGLDRLSQLESEESATIMAARSALKNENFAEFSAKIEVLSNIRERKATELQVHNEALVAASEALKEQAKFELEVLKTQADIQAKGYPREVQATRDAAVAGLFDQGITDVTTMLDYLNYDEEGNFVGDFTAEEISDTLGLIRPEGIDSELDELLSPNELVLFNAPAGSTMRDVVGQVPKTELTTTQKYTEENNLSKQFENLVGDARTAMTQIGVITTSLEEAKRAVEEGKSLNAPSQGVLVAFQKLLDPTSVVRESEYARSASGLSFISRLEGMKDKFLKGGAGVPVDELGEFVKVAEAYLTGYTENMLKHASRIELVAETRGLNLPSILTQDVIDLLEDRGAESMMTLDQYYQANPEQQQPIEQMLNDNPDLTDEEILQIISPTFSMAESDANNAQVNIAMRNRPQRNNNPGNVKKGGLADKYAEKNLDGSVKTDDQNHLVFNSPDAGFKAMRADIKAKIEGRSRYVPNNPTIAQIGKVYAEDTGWANSVASILGVDVNMKAKDIDFNKLIDAIARQEGYYA